MSIYAHTTGGWGTAQFGLEAFVSYGKKYYLELVAKCFSAVCEPGHEKTKNQTYLTPSCSKYFPHAKQDVFRELGKHVISHFARSAGN